jgi:hypothetical protein
MEQKTTIGRGTHRIVVVEPAQVNPHGAVLTFRFQKVAVVGDLSTPILRLSSHIGDSLIGRDRPTNTIDTIRIKMFRQRNNIKNHHNSTPVNADKCDKKSHFVYLA